MVAAGWSPSVRLFEAGGLRRAGRQRRLGRPRYPVPARAQEILLAETADDVLRTLRDCPEERRRAIGGGGPGRVLARHTAAARARELEAHLLEAAAARAGRQHTVPAAGAASGRSSA